MDHWMVVKSLHTDDCHNVSCSEDFFSLGGWVFQLLEPSLGAEDPPLFNGNNKCLIFVNLVFLQI